MSARMTVSEVRARYLTFFKNRNHTEIPSASLVPENDPTTLFTGSGMQPLVPFLLGEKHPAGTLLVNSQKCFRAEDIEEVGDNRHTTFFEMLGNWSLGEYFKKEQLRYFFEFLTDTDEGLGLDASRLYVTIFSGDETVGVPRDEESADVWQALFGEKGIADAKVVDLITEEEGGTRGMQDGRIFAYGAKKNWWSRAGVPENMPAGEPGGPDSEVFFDFDPSGAMHDTKYGERCHPNCDCGRFMEIGNSVFMQYRKNADGSFDELPQKNVDFGGGLERLTAAANNNADVFEIDVFRNVVHELENLSGKSYKDDNFTTSFRVIVDHLRAAVFLINDGTIPANSDAGYFTRRLIRRAVRHLDLLGIEKGEMVHVVTSITDSYLKVYVNTSDQAEYPLEVIVSEEEKFRRTLASGLKKLQGLVEIKLKDAGVVKVDNFFGSKSGHYVNAISGKEAFDLYQNYGFPFELIQEELAKYAMFPHEAEFKQEFNQAFTKHQTVSRAGAEKKFKGGLADTSEMSVKYHTGTHLLHQALRDVLGEEAVQKGSNITSERLRFDFAYPRKMTDEEKRRVEDIVNEKIAAALPVNFEIIPLEKARERGAIGLFEGAYGENVKVYKVGPADAKSREDGLYSFEFCGGPHVTNTSELGDGDKKFIIKKEEAISAGVRRIRAVLESQ